MEVNPRTLFERLFGDGDSTDAAARLEAMKERGSLLDFVKGSVDRLETQHGHGRPAQADANTWTRFATSNAAFRRRKSRTPRMKIPHIDLPVSAPEEFVDHARLMMDLMVIAYQADLTRVVTLHAGARRQQPQLPRRSTFPTAITTVRIIRTIR